MKKILILVLISLLFVSGCQQQERKPVLNENALVNYLKIPFEISKENIVEIKTQRFMHEADSITTYIDDKEQIERFIDELYKVEAPEVEYNGMYVGGSFEVSVKTKDGEWFFLWRNIGVFELERCNYLKGEKTQQYKLTNWGDLSAEWKHAYLGGD